MADKTTQKPARKPSPVKNGYLILYNAVSAILWLTVLGRIVGVNVIRGPRLAYPTVGEFCKWTQTLAGMEVLHSLFGKLHNFSSQLHRFWHTRMGWSSMTLFNPTQASNHSTTLPSQFLIHKEAPVLT